MAAILIDEDDKETNDAISAYLSELGYHTISVYNGNKGSYCPSSDESVLVQQLPIKSIYIGTL